MMIGICRTWPLCSVDKKYSRARVADVLDLENTASDRSAKNEEHLTRQALICIHRKKPKGRPMAERTRFANARESQSPLRCGARLR